MSRAWIIGGLVSVALGVGVVVAAGDGDAEEIASPSELAARVAAAVGLEADEETATDLLALLVPRGSDASDLNTVLEELRERLGEGFEDATADELVSAIAAELEASAPDGRIDDLDDLGVVAGGWARGLTLTLGGAPTIELSDGFATAAADAERAQTEGSIAIPVPIDGFEPVELWQVEMRVDTHEIRFRGEAPLFGTATEVTGVLTWEAGPSPITTVFVVADASLEDIVPLWEGPEVRLDRAVVALSTAAITTESPLGGSEIEVVGGATLVASTDLDPVPGMEDLLGLVGAAGGDVDLRGTLSSGAGFLGGGTTNQDEFRLTVELPPGPGAVPWVVQHQARLEFEVAGGSRITLVDEAEIEIGDSVRRRGIGTASLNLAESSSVRIAYVLEGTLDGPLGADWLSIADPTLEVVIDDTTTTGSVGGAFVVAGKTGTIAISLESGSATTGTATGTLSDLSAAEVVRVVQEVGGVALLPDGVTMPDDLAGLRDIAVSLSVSADESSLALSASAVVGGQTADALLMIVDPATGDAVATLGVVPTDWDLAAVLPAPLSDDPIVREIEVPQAALVLTGERQRTELQSLPGPAAAFFGEILGSDDLVIDLRPGLNVLGTVPAVGPGTLLADAMDLLGMDSSQPLMLQGTLPVGAFGGSAAGLDGIALQAALPPMSVSEGSSWLRSAQLAVRVSGEPSVGLAGILEVEIEGDVQVFEVETEVGRVAGGVALQVRGQTVDPWESPFGVEWMTVNQVVLELGIEPAGVSLGFLGDVQTGSKDLRGAIGITLSPAGVPTNFLFEAQSEAGLSLSDLADLQQLMSGGNRIPVESALPEMEVRELLLRFAPRGDPDLGVEAGFAVAGELWVAESAGGPLQPFAGMDLSVTTAGIDGAAFLNRFTLGPATWEDASVELALTPAEQRFAVTGGVELFDARQAIALEIDRTSMAFDSETTLGGFATEVGARASYDLAAPGWTVTGAMQGDFLDAVEDGLIVDLGDLERDLGRALDDAIDLKADLDDTLADLYDIIGKSVLPSRCSTLVLKVLVNACEDAKDALARQAATNRRIASLQRQLAALPGTISVDGASFSAGMEGFLGGTVAMAFDVGVGSARRSVGPTDWDFSVPFSREVGQLLDIII